VIQLKVCYAAGRYARNQGWALIEMVTETSVAAAMLDKFVEWGVAILLIAFLTML
jgi:hypothetical protein